MGLMEAQRYPDDFDGIVAGNPANDWTRFYAGAHLWYSLAMLEDQESWIPRSKLPAFGKAVNEACDALDGIEDGIYKIHSHVILSHPLYSAQWAQITALA